MRILVHAGTVHEGSRLWAGCAGLALRGHEVLWSGRRPPQGVAGLRHVAGGLFLARHHVDVVVGGGARVLPVWLAGALARARCMVLGIEPDEARCWNVMDRWAWSATHASGLVEAEAAATARAHLSEVVQERIGLWSDAEPASEASIAHPDVDVLERTCERALARQRGKSPRAAVFLDRDGTLVVERGYLSDPDDLELLPGVPEALAGLKAAGLALVVISNQSGVGRGFFPRARVHQAMARLRELLRAHGIEIDAIYFCPHRPDAGCDCRKPAPGLLERAAEDLQLSLVRSVMVGDKLLDVRTGHAAGGSGLLLRTGYGREEERALGEIERAQDGQAPEGIFEDLRDAAAWIAARVEQVPA